MPQPRNKVRVVSDESVVTNAEIYLRGPDGDWVNVSRVVRGADVKLRYGEASTATLDVVLVEGNLEAFHVDEATLQAFAATLRLYGWKVEEPE